MYKLRDIVLVTLLAVPCFIFPAVSQGAETLDVFKTADRLGYVFQSYAPGYKDFQTPMVVMATGIASGGSATVASQVDRWSFLSTFTAPGKDYSIKTTFNQGIFQPVEVQYTSVEITVVRVPILNASRTLEAAIQRMRTAGCEQCGRAFETVTVMQVLNHPWQEILYVFNLVDDNNPATPDIITVGSASGKVMSE
jgi:hypothetical protein